MSNESGELGQVVIKQVLPPSSYFLRNAWVIYKEKFNGFIRISLSALVGIAPFFIVLLIGGAYEIGLFKTADASFNTQDGIWFVFVIITGILALYYALQARVAIILYFDKSAQDDPKELFRSSKKFIYGFALVSLIVSCYLFLWALLLVIPAIIFGVYYSYARLVFLYEGIQGRAALKRSKELVKNYWWALVWRNLVIAGLGFLLGAFFGLLGAFFEDGSIVSFLLELVYRIVLWFYSIYSLLYNYSIYKSLVMIKSKPSTPTPVQA